MLIPCSVCLIVHTDIIHGCTLLQRSRLIASALSCVIVLGLWNESMYAWVEGAPVWIDVCWLVLSVCVGTDVWAQKDFYNSQFTVKYIPGGLVFESPPFCRQLSPGASVPCPCVWVNINCVWQVLVLLMTRVWTTLHTCSSHCSGLGSTLTVELN